MEETIESLYRTLSNPGIVPARGYNSIHYPLVCYVNMIEGLYRSAEFETVPIFLKRAYQHITALDSEYHKKPYYPLVLRYLALMADFIGTRAAISPGNKIHIPLELLAARPQ